MVQRRRMRFTGLSPLGIVRRWTPRNALAMFPARMIARQTSYMLKSTPFIRGRKPKRVYGSLGGLEVRLARTRADIRLAQRLRYQVFYEEMSAVPNAKAMLSRRDSDRYDKLCDHLLVIDNDTPLYWKGGWRRRGKVVGTYRVLRQDLAERNGGFYTQAEYDIAPLVAARPGYSFMELGRSCVLKPYRTKRTVELLWHGLWTYIREHGIDVMIGCASFEGTDPGAHRMALSFLHHYALAPPEWRVKAHKKRYVDMNLLPKDQVNAKAALKELPPLIKGYLRLGATIGDGAVIDNQFGTIDVCIILPVEKIDVRYFAHFGTPDETTSRLTQDAKGLM